MHQKVSWIGGYIFYIDRNKYFVQSWRDDIGLNLLAKVQLYVGKGKKLFAKIPGRREVCRLNRMISLFLPGHINICLSPVWKEVSGNSSK